MSSSRRPHTLEALFLRHLQQVSNRIHNTDRIEQIMLDASVDICRLFNADHQAFRDSFRKFVDTTRPDLLPRLDEMVALVLAEEDGDRIVIVELVDGCADVRRHGHFSQRQRMDNRHP